MIRILSRKDQFYYDYVQFNFEDSNGGSPQGNFVGNDIFVRGYLSYNFTHHEAFFSVEIYNTCHIDNGTLFFCYVVYGSVTCTYRGINDLPPAMTMRSSPFLNLHLLCKRERPVTSAFLEW